MEMIFPIIFIIFTIVSLIYSIYEVVNFFKIILNRLLPSKSQDSVKLSSSLAGDLKSLYNSAIFSDVKLRTLTQTFPSHKAILSVRSDVFKEIFKSGKNETYNDDVRITDLEDETVHRMLTFIYTDSVEDLKMESAFKLYKAADKYGLPYLKRKCSLVLTKNLRPTNACGVLLLAVIHKDAYLKTSVQHYIIQNYKEVFDTKEWKDFMATNIQLAAEVMYQKISKSRTEQ